MKLDWIEIVPETPSEAEVMKAIIGMPAQKCLRGEHEAAEGYLLSHWPQVEPQATHEPLFVEFCTHCRCLYVAR